MQSYTRIERKVLPFYWMQAIVHSVCVPMILLNLFFVCYKRNKSDVRLVVTCFILVWAGFPVIKLAGSARRPLLSSLDRWIIHSDKRTDHPLIQTPMTKSYTGRNESSLQFRVENRFRLLAQHHPDDDALADF